MKEGWIIYLTCPTFVLDSAVVDVTVTPYRIALVNGRVTDSKILDYMPSIFYIVKLPLALSNISTGLNPYWHSHFWHCLIVMTYRNRAPFLLVSTWLSRFKNRYGADVFYA